MSDPTVGPGPRWYTREHLWLEHASSDATARIGIASGALEGLGELTFLDLPDVGARIVAGQPFGVVGSTKSEADLIAPVTGAVIERNGAAVADPMGSTSTTTPSDASRTAPGGDGPWLLTVRLEVEGWEPSAAGLVDADGYATHGSAGR